MATQQFSNNSSPSAASKGGTFDLNNPTGQMQQPLFDLNNPMGQPTQSNSKGGTFTPDSTSRHIFQPTKRQTTINNLQNMPGRVRIF